MSDLTTWPTHIARIQKAGDDHIICGAVSPDGSGVAFSDGQGLHLYQLSTQNDANRLDDTQAMATVADQPELAVSKARLQQVASGQAGQKLIRLTAAEDLPSFHELQYRPGCAQVVGLTPQGTLVVLDTQTATVCPLYVHALTSFFFYMHLHATFCSAILPGDQHTGSLGTLIMTCRFPAIPIM